MLLNTSGDVVYFGGDAALLLGLDPVAAVQRSIYDVTPIVTQASIQSALEHALSGVTDPPFLVETEMVDGSKRSLTFQLVPLIENGSVLAVTTAVMEVSSRQAANAALHGDFLSSQMMSRGSSLTFFHLDGRGQCTFMAQSWNRATGQPLSDALGTGWLQAIPEDGRQVFRAVAGAAHQMRHGWITELPIFRRTGEVLATMAAASPIMDSSGGTIGYVGAIHFPELAVCPAKPHALEPLPAASNASNASNEPTATSPEANTDFLRDDDSPADTYTDLAAPTQFSPPQFASPVEEHVVEEHAEEHVVEEHAIQEHAQEHAQEHVVEEHVTDDRVSTPSDVNETVATGWSVADPGQVATPVAPAPKFALREAPTSGDWNPPALQEGFTDPSLLLGQKQEPVREEAPVPNEDPGVDKTTGLANKLLFAQHVQATTARMQADALTVSVSFIDLHGLELQQAAVGTRVANDYLFLLAKRLEATIRSIEIAGRIDGNILAVLSINWLFAEDLPVVARRLIGKLSEPLAGKENSDLIVAMNLGMAVASPNEDVNSLFRRAWEALQIAKARGNGEFEINISA